MMISRWICASDPGKERILGKLWEFAHQRPGLDPRNYGEGMTGRRLYDRERAEILRNLRDFRTIYTKVAIRDRVSAQDIERAAQGRRLRWNGETWDYVTGQYFPMEYRRAATQLLADVLWRKAQDERESNEPGFGDTVRRWFRLEFGRRIARRYFD